MKVINTFYGIVLFLHLPLSCSTKPLVVFTFTLAGLFPSSDEMLHQLINCR